MFFYCFPSSCSRFSSEHVQNSHQSEPNLEHQNEYLPCTNRLVNGLNQNRSESRKEVGIQNMPDQLF